MNRLTVLYHVTQAGIVIVVFVYIFRGLGA